ncbi:hypothetical protein NKG05_22305 [Oerskovia sp. M15]
MGFRNPFRIGIDPDSGNVLVADYGPDSGAADPNRGPRGAVEWNVVSEPGFYGWPYCTGRTPRTSTTTSRPGSPVRRSTAPPAQSTTHRTTRVSSSCRPLRPRRSGTPVRPTRCSRRSVAAAHPWVVRSTSSTRSSTPT